MNTLEKIYCRSFQSIMRMAIPVLPYREPKLLDGVDKIVDVLGEKKINRVILVTGPNVRRLGLTAPLERTLEKNGVMCAVYDRTEANPTSKNVEDALALYRENNCQAIIAFGGGSPMDCAKALGARVARPRKTLKKMRGLLKVIKPIPTLIAIPTTAGTGSEVTVASVITDAKTHHKYVINDFCLIPKYAVMSPEVTVGLSPKLTATTGMDALTHAIEAYIGRARTKKTRAAAEEAVRLIFENLELAFADGTNLEARRNMLYASYLAGTAFTKSYVGYVHAVAHTLGGKYGVAHGLANAILLPHVLRAYGLHAEERLSELAKRVGIAPADADRSVAAEALISHIEGMNARMQIPARFDCIIDSDIKEMAALADKEANPLYPVPVLWGADELEDIYRMVK